VKYRIPLTKGRYGTDPGKYDADFVRETLDRVGFLFGPGRYFRLEVQGWDHIPPAPTMMVSNHSGGTTIPDIWGLMASWHRHFDAQRPIHPLAHDMVMSVRATGRFFSRLGVLRANPKLAQEALEKWKRDVVVMPGGDLEVWRPHRERYQVNFGGKRGYARLALRCRVPIVPVANAGAHDTLFVLSDGQKIARMIQFEKLVRTRVFPIHLSLPWGFFVGPVPHIPLPVKLRYRIAPAILPPDFGPLGSEPPQALVDEHDARVRTAIQELLDQLRDDEESLGMRVKKGARGILGVARKMVDDWSSKGPGGR
jgi:1-acyl-sn-glycerol-3-phosphate acyltransferase